MAKNSKLVHSIEEVEPYLGWSFENLVGGNGESRQVLQRNLWLLALFSKFPGNGSMGKNSKAYQSIEKVKLYLGWRLEKLVYWIGESRRVLRRNLRSPGLFSKFWGNDSMETNSKLVHSIEQVELYHGGSFENLVWWNGESRGAFRRNLRFPGLFCKFWGNGSITKNSKLVHSIEKVKSYLWWSFERMVWWIGESRQVRLKNQAF
jgi:hypothetical protein